jgi:hypothetical protein
MQVNSYKCFQVLFLFFWLLLNVGIQAQIPEKQAKEEKKQAEQQRKDREKQAKEEAKRQTENAKAQTLLMKLIPIGKEANYDRFKDITTVNSMGMIVYPLDRNIQFEFAFVGMWARYSVQGQFGASPPSIRLLLHGQTLLIGSPSNPCSLSMILNGTERVQFGQMSYGRTIRLGNIGWVDMSLNSFRSLATSKSIEMQSCRFETSLNPRHISGLATLLEGLPQASVSTITGPRKAIGPLHPHIGTWTFQMTRDGVPEDWEIQLDGEPGALTGVLKMGKGGEISLTNVISSGPFLSGGASEIVQGGMNMVTFSGQTSENVLKGKITFWLLGRQQAPIAIEAKRTSAP